LSHANTFLKLTDAVPHFLTINTFGEKGIGLPLASVNAPACFSSSVNAAAHAAVFQGDLLVN